MVGPVVRPSQILPAQERQSGHLFNYFDFFLLLFNYNQNFFLVKIKQAANTSAVRWIRATWDHRNRKLLFSFFVRVRDCIRGANTSAIPQLTKYFLPVHFPCRCVTETAYVDTSQHI